MLTKKQINELFQAVLELNGLEERRQEVTGNLPTAFFDFMGHVPVVNVRIHPKGYRSDYDPYTDEKSFCIYTDETCGDTFKSCMDFISEIKEFIKKRGKVKC